MRSARLVMVALLTGPLACRPAVDTTTSAPPQVLGSPDRAALSTAVSEALPAARPTVAARESIRCCHDAPSSALLDAALAVDAALADEQPAALPALASNLASAAAIIEPADPGPRIDPASAQRVAVLAAAMADVSLPLAREYQAEIWARIYQSLLASASGRDTGALDLAVACSHHGWIWIEDNEERHDPYGSGVVTTWGACTDSPLLRPLPTSNESQNG